MELFYKNDFVTLYCGDCLEVMPQLDEKFDCCITDPPYGTTHCMWDVVIPFEHMWKNLENLVKSNGAICLFGQGMFTAELMMSNSKLWRYNIVWNKMRVTGFLNAKRMPLRCHEDIVLFYKCLPDYHPQMTFGNKSHSTGSGIHKQTNQCYGDFKFQNSTNPSNEKFLQSIISIPKEHNKQMIHPTQKPVKLLEYLINTYTNEGDIILDFCAGSGSLGEACMNTNRRCVLIEKEEKYCEAIVKRLKNHSVQERLI